jgi:hypothetical protein
MHRRWLIKHPENSETLAVALADNINHDSARFWTRMGARLRQAVLRLPMNMPVLLR